MREEELCLKRKQTLSSEQPEKRIKCEEVALPDELVNDISTRDYTITNINKKYDNAGSQQYYSFHLQFKVPSRYHPHGRQTAVAYDAVAFQYDHHDDYKLLKLDALYNRWIILPNHHHHHDNDTIEHFYKALTHFAKHWNQWLEENNMSGDKYDGFVSTDDHDVTNSAQIVEFKRIVWPDEASYLPYYNSVNVKRTQKRRRSIVMEDMGVDDSVWNRYLILEFVEASAVNSCLICVHDIVSGVTKSKIRDSIIESCDSITISDQSSPSPMALPGRRFSVSSSVDSPNVVGATRRFSISADLPSSVTGLL
jgi:hypothetical protein